MAHFYEFPTSVIEKIGYYVYLLVDPRNGETFYIGKGNGNRIFSHLNATLSHPQRTDKQSRIREIIKSGLEVDHKILRHGLTEKEAFEVEAASIDLLGLDELTNQVSGYDSNSRGLMTARDLIAEYGSKSIEISEPSILIIVNRLYRFGMTKDELYEITRGNWVVGLRRENAKYGFSVYRGIVREVYRINDWFPVKARSKSQSKQDRWRFNGEIANELSEYIGGDVSHYINQGSQNPIRYINC